MAKVFISHSWDDNAVSRKLAEYLRCDGAEVWIDYARIQGGDSLPKIISDAIDWCDTLILIWSKSAKESFWVGEEWTCAYSLQKRIIPCITDKASLPSLLRSKLYLDFSDFDCGYQDLARTLKLSIKISRADSSRETTPISPEPEYPTTPEPREKTAPEFKPKFDPKSIKKPNRYRMIGILALVLVSTLGGYIAFKSGCIVKKPADSQTQSDSLKTNIPVSLPSDTNQKKMADRKSETRSWGDQDISKPPAGQENIKKPMPETQTPKKTSQTSDPIQTHEELSVKKPDDKLTTSAVSGRKLRKYPLTLSRDNVKNMLQDWDFFCKERDRTKEFCNPSGKGFENDFVLQKNGQVVYDRNSGLMWQQSGSKESLTYEAAEQYIVKLNRDRFADLDGWRLPTLEEGMSLMEREKLNGDLYIDPKYDPKQWYIWTSDPGLGGSGRVWVVFFDFGGCYHCYVDDFYDYYIRAVRSGQSSP